MAELSTNISVKQQGRGRQTNMIPRYQQGAEITNTLRPVVTLASAAAADDIIFLGYLDPGQFLFADLCNAVSADVDADSTGSYVFDVGFRALNGASAADAWDGTSTNNDPDLFADGITLSAGGKIEFTSVPIAYHWAPTIFRDRVEIIATLKAETTPDADVNVAFNLYLGEGY